ncbi:MAG: acyltransferase [Halobacteriota archaeon]
MAPQSTPEESRIAGEIGLARLGSNVTVEARATVGYVHDEHAEPTIVGDGAHIRSGTIVYADVELGEDFTTGHRALVREATTVGSSTLLGTGSVLDGHVTVGSNVSIQTNVYVPTETVIGDRVFLGPSAVLTNDPYPLRQDVDLVGPTLEDDVTVGANATVLPDLTIGEGSFVAAGAIVTKDVPPETLVVGIPGEHRPLPDSLTGGNRS